jgi:hypothetical protein
MGERQTRFDLQDTHLWQHVGLVADENGFLMPSTPSDATETSMSAEIEEETKSNELTWLLGKIVNFLTSGDALSPEGYSLPSGQRQLVGVTQEQLKERWKLLAGQLHSWHRSLSTNFWPIARTTLPDCATPSVSGFARIWYEVPMCAATMQRYHMACILLLVNEPQESTAVRSTISARLNSYRKSEREATRHAQEICGISFADIPDSVRINSVQPLFVAAQVLNQSQDQHMIVSLLSDIEKDLGWTTSNHTSRLAYLSSIEDRSGCLFP